MTQQFHSRVCIQRSRDLTDVSAFLCSAALFPVAGCGHNLDVCRQINAQRKCQTHTHTHTHTQWSLTQPLKKRNPPFKTTWVKLEDIMSSKVSQTQTGKCSRSSLSVESKTDSEKRRRT